jgi:glucose-6-phosphate 1-dehydrogenase
MGPFVIVIFGATGDLAQNKLLPALFSLYQQNALGKEFFIVGFARRPFTDQEYRKMLGENLGHQGKSWEKFVKNIYYQQGLFDEQAGYEELITKLKKFDDKIGACITRLFYLATPPDNYERILDFMKATKLSDGCSSDIAKDSGDKLTKLVIEKPFGKDLETAIHLDKKLGEMFEEHQIYRVDHYLAKELVQNMIAFRFANSIFEPVWNKEYIDHVQISVLEKEGVRNRGKFFDGIGMLRDVGQNHLLQLLATVAMEQPKTFSREGVRDVRAQAIKAIRPFSPETVSESVVRGQYKGYKQEKNIAEDSTTETFIAMKLFVDSPRLEGVPFYLRSGKKMNKEVMDIKIVFKQTCHLLFKEYGCPEIGNVLTIKVQPDEGIGIGIIVKTPGAKVAMSKVEMKFSYMEEFKQHGLEAYDKLLLDILAGDQMLFNRSDELASSWELISTILHSWSRETGEKNQFKIPVYEEATWGPQEANTLIEKDGRKWL